MKHGTDVQNVICDNNEAICLQACRRCWDKELAMNAHLKTGMNGKVEVRTVPKNEGVEMIRDFFFDEDGQWRRKSHDHSGKGTGI